jgi:hypothetical protein
VDHNPLGHAGDFTATIDWGDGSPSSTGKVTARGAGLFAVSGNHMYTSGGKRQITISVVDEGGSMTTIHSRVLVFPF